MNLDILYIGRYELPDKDATANRVVANAKLLRALGHNVVLAGWSSEVKKNAGWKIGSYFGFESYEKYKERNSIDKLSTFLNASLELNLIASKHFDAVIAYNFPAVAFKRILNYCTKNHIKCYSDVTEWFTNKNKNPLFSLVKAYDSYLRMKVLNRKVNGLIVISRYLEDYYANEKTVLVPPLVDKTEPKWNLPRRIVGNKIYFVYAGWPSKVKERLDLLVDSIDELSSQYDIQIDIYGIDENQYRGMYQVDSDKKIASAVIFHGRVSHTDTLRAVSCAHYSLIIRESSRKNNAGFPSKLVESISCGTPVLTTSISNVKDYVGDGKNGFIISIDSLKEDLIFAIDNVEKTTVDSELFDYRKYSSILKDLFE